MEGFGSEVLFMTSVFIGILGILLIFYALWRRQVRVAIVPGNPGVAPFVDNINNHPTCPICLESMILPVETNCGHVFCGSCLRSLHESRSFFRQNMDCPLCRRKISMLFPCFSPHYPMPYPVGPAAEVMTFTTFYNNLFEDESLWNLIRNSPILIRHYFNRVLEQGLNVDPALVNGLLFMGFIILYVLLPFDLVPESAFGILGYFDDILFAIYWVLYVCRLYRHYIT